MEQYSQDHFTRSGSRLRSPISQRRARRLARFALASAALAAGGIMLLVLALGG